MLICFCIRYIICMEDAHTWVNNCTKMAGHWYAHYWFKSTQNSCLIWCCIQRHFEIIKALMSVLVSHVNICKRWQDVLTFTIVCRLYVTTGEYMVAWVDIGPTRADSFYIVLMGAYANCVLGIQNTGEQHILGTIAFGCGGLTVWGYFFFTVKWTFIVSLWSGWNYESLYISR